jgi:hypothetical protein
MSHSDRRFDKKFQLSRQRGRIVKWFSPMEVLFFEIEEIVEHPLTACNLDCLQPSLSIVTAARSRQLRRCVQER